MLNQDQEYIIASNLSSGHFEEEIPYLSSNHISQYTDSEYNYFFIKMIVDHNKGALKVWHVEKSSGEKHACEIKMNNDKPYINGSSSIKSGDTVYFKHLSKTFCFFINFLDSNVLDLHTLYEIKRRFWKRYKTKQQNIKIKLFNENKSTIEGEIVNFGLKGLLVSSKSEPGNLFESSLIEIHDYKVKCSGQIVHLQKTKDGYRFGFYFNDDNDQYLNEFYSEQILSNEIVTIGESSNINELKNAFETAAFPQPYSETYINSDHDLKTVMLLENGRYTSGISMSRYNQKLQLLHTLVLSKTHVNSLPVQLYEYLANLMLSNTESKYFCGYWPSKNKYLDRGYTNFVKSDYDQAHHFYKQISIYACKSSYQKNLDNQNQEISKLDIEAIKQYIKNTYQEVFYNAFEISKLLDNLNSNDYKLIVTKNKDGLRGIGLCFLKKSAISVFGLSSQLWVLKAEKTGDIKSLIDIANNYFSSNQEDIYNIHTFKHDENILKIKNIFKSLKEVNFWVADQSRAKAYINYLEKVNFELKVLSSKNKISRQHVKYLKNFTSSFFKRKSLRYHSKNLLEDISIAIDLGPVSLESVLVNDLDTFGMSIEVPSNVYLKELQTIEVQFKLNENDLECIKAKIKYCKPKVVSGFKSLANIVGLEFVDLDINSKRAIREYCFRKLNPDLSMFSKEDFKSLAKLLADSKYFEYYDSTKQQQFERESENTYKSLDLMVPDLARVTIFKNDDNKIIGTHSFYRRANKTWQLHQLAVDETLAIYKTKIPTRVVLNGAFQYLCLDPDVNYFITYFHNDAAIAKTYFDVQNHHDDPREYAYIEFTGFLFENLDKSEFKPNTKFKLSVAKNSELDQIQKNLKNIVPSIEYDALDYGNLSQSKFIQQWNQQGPKRDREVFLIKDQQDKILHIAICDLSPLGINFIGLVDIFKIYNYDKSIVPTSESLNEIAQYSTQFYKANGRTQVYLEVEPELGYFFDKIEARKLGKNWRLIASRNTFMTALQYFNNRFERLKQRLKQQGQNK